MRRFINVKMKHILTLNTDIGDYTSTNLNAIPIILFKNISKIALQRTVINLLKQFKLSRVSKSVTNNEITFRSI